MGFAVLAAIDTLGIEVDVVRKAHLDRSLSRLLRRPDSERTRFSWSGGSVSSLSKHEDLCCYPSMKSVLKKRCEKKSIFLQTSTAEI